MKSYLILFSVIIFNRATLSIRFPDNDEDSEKGNELFKRGSLVRFPEGVNGLDDPTLQECGVSKFNRQRQPRLDENTFTSLLNSYGSSRMIDFDKIGNDQLKRDRHKGRIINGKESKPGAWPWQVSLQLLHPKWGAIGHWCGGVLLRGVEANDFWVLTAAHCISNDAFSYPYGPMWTAVLGEHDRLQEEGYEQRLMVEKVILHERFKEYHNDIALMKLQRPLNPTNISTDRIRAICLPPGDNGDIFMGVKCVATGWGQSKYGSKLDHLLHQTELPVVENSHCKQVYGTMYNIPIDNYHLCAGPISEGGAGTCIGDSGGPLSCMGPYGRWYLAGITSFGSGCAKPGYPDVFTRVTYYLDWIRTTISSANSTSLPNHK